MNTFDTIKFLKGEIITKMTNRRAFTLGAIIGIVFSGTVVITGSLEFFPPLWQEVLLYPGFLVGSLFYRFCSNWFPVAEQAAGYIGLLAVWVSYGFASMGLWHLFRWFNRSSTV
jgi:hypothetical protein